MNDSVHHKGSDTVCTQYARSQDMRGSASRNGEARRKRAAKRERSKARGGRTTRWGWAGGSY